MNWEARMKRTWENCAVFPGRHFVFVEESQYGADISHFIRNLGRHVAFVIGSYEDANQSTLMGQFVLEFLEFHFLCVIKGWKQTRGSFLGAILFLFPQTRRMQTWDILSDLFSSYFVVEEDATWGTLSAPPFKKKQMTQTQSSVSAEFPGRHFVSFQ